MRCSLPGAAAAVLAACAACLTLLALHTPPPRPGSRPDSAMAAPAALRAPSIFITHGGAPGGGRELLPCVQSQQPPAAARPSAARRKAHPMQAPAHQARRLYPTWPCLLRRRALPRDWRAWARVADGLPQGLACDAGVQAQGAARGFGAPRGAGGHGDLGAAARADLRLPRCMPALALLAPPAALALLPLAAAPHLPLHGCRCQPRPSRPCPLGRPAAQASRPRATACSIPPPAAPSWRGAWRRRCRRRASSAGRTPSGGGTTESSSRSWCAWWGGWGRAGRQRVQGGAGHRPAACRPHRLVSVRASLAPAVPAADVPAGRHPCGGAVAAVVDGPARARGAGRGAGAPARRRRAHHRQRQQVRGAGQGCWHGPVRGGPQRGGRDTGDPAAER